MYCSQSRCGTQSIPGGGVSSLAIVAGNVVESGIAAETVILGVIFSSVANGNVRVGDGVSMAVLLVLEDKLQPETTKISRITGINDFKMSPLGVCY